VQSFARHEPDGLYEIAPAILRDGCHRPALIARPIRARDRFIRQLD
jgi:hypothetical protein